MPGNACGLGDELADVAAIGIENFLLAYQDITQFQTVSFPERPIENRASDFETDEIVVAVRSVAFPRNLENVEAEFGLHMRKPAVFIGNAVAVFFPEARIE